MLSGSDTIPNRVIAPTGSSDSGDLRLLQLVKWLNSLSTENVDRIERASSDASFRRYFRVTLNGRTRIAMDAPPAAESLGSFIRVARLFRAAGVCVPEILAYSEDHGFMLLGDLGSISYLSRLDPETAPRLYGDAMDVLRLFKNKLPVTGCGLPDYDRDLLQRELDLFEQWFLAAKLGIRLSNAESKLLNDLQSFLIDTILEQPKIVVHRDFHSRNLMLVEEHNPGVLDFQDAVTGPLTYDLVSLLRDCYVAWPESTVDRWVADYFSSLDLREITYEQFYRWFDLTGLQRHLKVLGIFSRLDLRDGKPGYLADIPRIMNYIRMVCSRHAELLPFREFLTTRVAEHAENLIAL
ncbi:MAG: aminoglycoside phosphotransferase family protein [Gammaproteobacteria bacterium]